MSLSGASAAGVSRWRSWGIRASDSHPVTKPDNQEEERLPGARARRRPPVARQRGHHRTEDTLRRRGGKEHFTEPAGVEGEDEAAKREVSLPLATVEGREGPPAQVTGGEGTVERLAGLQSGFERDPHPRREDRIEEGPGIADEQPAIARVGARLEREVLLDPHRPFALRQRHEGGHGRRLPD